MSEGNISGAEPIPQTGEAAWFPPVEDDAEALLQHQPPTKDLRWAFFGKDGLRAGWSILLFLLIVFVLGFAISRIMRLLHHVPDSRVGGMTASSTIIGEALSFGVVALAGLCVSLLEKRRFAQYGIGNLRGRFAQFVTGSLWGAALLSTLVALLDAKGVLVFTGTLLSGAAVLHWGLLWAVAFLLVGFFEEFLTRGFLQFTVARGVAGIAGSLGMGDRSRKVLGFWIAALFFSFIFGFGHKNNAGESPIGLISAGLIGLVFAFSLWRTGSLWWAIGYHAAWDWMQSFVYGVADSGNMVQHHLLGSHPQGPTLLSGGLTGPEGSVFVLAECVITGLVIAFSLPSQPGSPSDPAYSPNDPLLTR